MNLGYVWMGGRRKARVLLFAAIVAWTLGTAYAVDARDYALQTATAQESMSHWPDLACGGPCGDPGGG